MREFSVEGNELKWLDADKATHYVVSSKRNGQNLPEFEVPKSSLDLQDRGIEASDLVTIRSVRKIIDEELILMSDWSGPFKIPSNEDKKVRFSQIALEKVRRCLYQIYSKY